MNPRPGIDHVTITATDLRAALTFYDAALGALGLVRLDELVDEEEDDAPVEAAGWGPPGGTAVLWLVAAVSGGTPTSGLHVRLPATSPTEVERFHDAALAAGGREHTAPRPWTLYRAGEFGATVCDPAGNLVEVVAAD